MTELTVENRNGVLVVDSRLVAEQLGIENRSLLQTLDTYLKKIELEFGAVTFEMLPTNSKGSKQRIAYLNEEQATFLMTLSRNTEEVVQAKINLVKAFTKAKQALVTISPEVIQMFQVMTDKMNILTDRTKKLDEVEKATNNNKGIKGVINTEIEDTYPEELELTVREYLDYKGVGLVHLNKMRKRAITFYRQGVQSEELPKKNKEVVFKGNAIGYLDQALLTVLDLD